jgi:hypothetical protein
MSERIGREIGNCISAVFLFVAAVALGPLWGLRADESNLKGFERSLPGGRVTVERWIRLFGGPR